MRVRRFEQDHDSRDHVEVSRSASGGVCIVCSEFNFPASVVILGVERAAELGRYLIQLAEGGE